MLGTSVPSENLKSISRATNQIMAKLITGVLASLASTDAIRVGVTPRAQVQMISLPEVESVLSAASPGEWAGKEGTHVPQLEVENGKAKITVPHGMADEHWINYVWAKDGAGKVIASVELKPTDTPTLEFDVPDGVSSITAFESCNLHSVWQSEPVSF